MSGTEDEREDEAIGWVLRLPDADGATWLRFTEWLEADPRNAAAYRRLKILGDGLTSDPLPPAPTATLPRSTPRRLPPYLVAAAAAIAAVVGGALLVPERRQPDLVLTVPVGMQRVFALRDGSRVALAGGARLDVSRGRARTARLLAGSVRFHVIHDETNRFEVLLGDDKIVDVGTDFAISRLGGRSEIAVIDGAVLFNPERERLTLGAGDRVVDPDGSGEIERSRVDPATIAQWASGSLSFHDAGLTEVARELAHGTGVPFTVDPALAGRRFTGRIALPGGDLPMLRRRVGALLGVAVVPTSAGWRLSPADRAPR